MSTDYRFKREVTVSEFLDKLPSNIIYNPTLQPPQTGFKITIRIDECGHDNSWLWIFAEHGIISTIVRNGSINDGANMIPQICDSLGVEIESDDGEIFKPRTSDPESPPVDSETPG
jgi:hypothetical protein